MRSTSSRRLQRRRENEADRAAAGVACARVRPAAGLDLWCHGFLFGLGDARCADIPAVTVCTPDPDAGGRSLEKAAAGRDGGRGPGFDRGIGRLLLDDVL